MREGNCGTELFVAEQGTLNRRISMRYPTKADINAALLQRGHLLQRRDFKQYRLDIGAGGAVAADDLGEPALHGRSAGARAQSGRLYLLQTRPHPPPLIDRVPY